MATHRLQDSAIRDLVTSEDLTADQKVRAIQMSIKDSVDQEILGQLKKINMYFAMITDQDIGDIE